jgi:hypothetical protein
VVTLPAGDEKRPHAELAHVAQRHRLDRLVEASHAGPTAVDELSTLLRGRPTLRDIVRGVPSGFLP